jgi:hypothetical protein
LTMQLIETKTLASAAASIEFTSIPQDGTDLYVLVSLRHATTTTDLYLTFNTGGTYSVRYLLGNGASASSAAQSNSQVGLVTTVSNTFTSTSIYVPNYTSSNAKSFSSDDVTENNGTTAYQSIWAGLWTGTDAITTLKLAPQSGNLAADSTISLYKVTKGSDGIVTTS